MKTYLICNECFITTIAEYFKVFPVDSGGLGVTEINSHSTCLNIKIHSNLG